MALYAYMVTCSFFRTEHALWEEIVESLASETVRELG